MPMRRLLPHVSCVVYAAVPPPLLECSTPPCASTAQHAPVRFYSTARPRALLQCSAPPCASTVQDAPVRFYSAARPRAIAISDTPAVSESGDKLL